MTPRPQDADIDAARARLAEAVRRGPAEWEAIKDCNNWKLLVADLDLLLAAHAAERERADGLVAHLTGVGSGPRPPNPPENRPAAEGLLSAGTRPQLFRGDPASVITSYEREVDQYNDGVTAAEAFAKNDDPLWPTEAWDAEPVYDVSMDSFASGWATVAYKPLVITVRAQREQLAALRARVEQAERERDEARGNWEGAENEVADLKRHRDFNAVHWDEALKQRDRAEAALALARADQEAANAAGAMAVADKQRAEAALAGMRAWLEKHQWDARDENEMPRCIMCNRRERFGHHEDCSLARALSDTAGQAASEVLKAAREWCKAEEYPFERHAECCNALRLAVQKMEGK